MAAGKPEKAPKKEEGQEITPVSEELPLSQGRVINIGSFVITGNLGGAQLSTGLQFFGAADLETWNAIAVATAALNQAVLTGRLTEADEELLKTVRAVNVLGFGLELIVPDKLMVLLHGQGLYGSARLHGPADGLLIRTAGATVQGTNYGLKVVEAGGQTFGPALNFAVALGHNALTFGLNVVPFASIAHGSFDEGTMIAGWSRAAARALERPKKED